MHVYHNNGVMGIPSIICGSSHYRPTCPKNRIALTIFCLTNMCKFPFICYKKTFEILRFRHLNRKKTFEFKFPVGQHVVRFALALRHHCEDSLIALIKKYQQLLNTPSQWFSCMSCTSRSAVFRFFFFCYYLSK